MSVTVLNRNGREVVLLNPSEKGRKYAIEMRHKKAITNEGKRKYDDNGNQIKLNKEQLAFRSGYLTAMSDSSKAYRSKHPRYKRKTS